LTFSVSILATTCYYQSNHSKVEAILLSALRGHNKRTVGLSSHYPVNAKRQAGKLSILTFKVFGLTLQGNRTLV